MKLAEIKKLSKEERKKKLKQLKEDLWNLRIQQKAAGTLENPSAIKTLKRDIARLLTLLREEER